MPAARQDVVDSVVAGWLKADLVVEGTNLPVTPGGLDVLRERGIHVVPDFVAAGSVVASAFAMDARYSVFPVARDVVLGAISDRLRSNTVTVPEDARPHVMPEQW